VGYCLGNFELDNARSVEEGRSLFCAI